MTKQSIANFIEEKRNEGLDDGKITHLLLEHGWQMDIIRHVLRSKPENHRDLQPILDFKRQPFRKIVLIGLPIMVFLTLCYVALKLKV